VLGLGYSVCEMSIEMTIVCIKKYYLYLSRLSYLLLFANLALQRKKYLSLNSRVTINNLKIYFIDCTKFLIKYYSFEYR